MPGQRRRRHQRPSNLVRARGEWSLAKSVRDRRDELRQMVAQAAR